LETVLEWFTFSFIFIYFFIILIIIAPNKCELNCFAENELYYVTFSETVQDGTPCDRHYSSVCIKNECVPLGCDKIINSKIVYDTCGICGGNSSTCSTFRGVFHGNLIHKGLLELI
jgi:thrombospondin motif-containing protein 5